MIRMSRVTVKCASTDEVGAHGRKGGERGA
jgi:hypothetical protein